jgi:hypothetical protein
MSTTQQPPTAPPSPTLDPVLAEEWDDEDDTRWKAPLAALIDGSQSPSQAAQSTNTLLRTETSTRLQVLRAHVTQNPTAAQANEWPDNMYAPNASALIQDVMRSWVRVCSAYAPYSAGQDALVQYLEELKALPKWRAAESRPDEKGAAEETEVWVFGFGWLGLEDEFRRVVGGMYLLASRGEFVDGANKVIDLKPGYYRDPAAHNRWRNFQHAMARLTANKLIYCAPFNALQDITPASPPTRSFEFDIVAAAQWVAWPTECRYVYQECQKKATSEHYWEPWGKMQWTLWMQAFGRVADDSTYDDATRAVARKAMRQMKEVEEEVDEEGSVGGSDAE